MCHEYVSAEEMEEYWAETIEATEGETEDATPREPLARATDD